MRLNSQTTKSTTLNQTTANPPKAAVSKLSPKRGVDESFEDYKKRRAQTNYLVKEYLRLGTPVYEMKFLRGSDGIVRGVPYRKENG